MKRLEELIEIDEKFQNSINLQLDIDNLQKMEGYIPTRSSLSVLEKFCNNILENKNNATVLIGPYGKGKSHLLLVLLGILSNDNDNVDKIIKRIGSVSGEICTKIKKIKEDKKKFLPVIVSETNSDLNQGFLLALSEALKKKQLMNIMPDSYFSKAIETIEKWKKSYTDTYNQFIDILAAYGITIKEYKKSLISMNSESLNIFRKIYPKLTAGSEFNPLVKSNAMNIYKEVAETLKKNNYKGIYIIFDEFSKYIEGHEKETFSSDMKILQDMCELANNSKEQQIHITFVAHKSIKEYGKSIPTEMINAFTGVEGRLKEIRFVMSSQNNYEIIKHVIKKKKDLYEEIINENKKIIETSYKIPCFNVSFNKNEYDEIVVKGCFPLLPLTSYCLLSISEKVAQNERSIFTFLAGNEKGSVINLIKDREELLSVDTVYDYFKNLFKENVSLIAIHNEWLKADYALGKAQSLAEEKIIKSLAVLHMINKNEEVPVCEDEIRCATGLNQIEFKSALKNLVQKDVIVFRSKLGVYAFKNNIGINIEKELNQVIEKQPLSMKWSIEFDKVSDLEYVLPKKYNQEYTMTRFFKYVYMTPDQYMELNDSEYLFEESKADGIIICLIILKQTEMEQIRKHTEQLSDKRLVVIWPKQYFKQQQNIRKINAVETLLKDKNFLEENKVLKQELTLFLEDLLFEVNAELEQIYMPENGRSVVLSSYGQKDFRNNIEFNRFLSDICADYYEYAPKINNELINRQNVSAQVRKARNNIIEKILKEDDLSVFQKGTSQEATIFRATLLHTGILYNDASDLGCKKIVKIIREFIKKCEGKKTSFSVLYSMLMGKEFGTRKGVIPIYIANEIIRLNDTPVIYLKDVETEITSEILNNINEKPQEYSLYVEKESGEKERYLDKLENLFVFENTKNGETHKIQRLNNIVSGMQKWYRSLDQYTLTFTEQLFNKGEKHYLDEVTFDELCTLRKIFKNVDLNPREILFEKIPGTFGKNNNYEKCSEKICQIKLYMDENMNFLKEKVSKSIKKIFGAKTNESLLAVLKNWYSNQSDIVKTHIFEENVTGFMNYIKKIDTNDESEIVSRLCKIVSGVYINDWKNNSYDIFLDELTTIKIKVENTKEIDNVGENRIVIESGNKKLEKFFNNDDEDSTSYFLENAIEEAIDEFGDTLELNQKISVLAKALENLLNK